MTELSFPAYPGPKLEAYVSRLLDEAGVPSFLWGESVLAILRVPTADFFSGWVVPDDCIEKASRALDEAKFPPCTLGERCSLFWHHRTHPIPDHHYHTDLEYSETPPHMSCGVFLYKKSRLFWSFPDPPIGRPSPNDPYYVLTSDTRLREGGLTTRGRSQPGDYPVKMPIPARYLEAMILLELRDLVGKVTSAHWKVEINYLADFVLRKENNPALSFEDIAEPFREFVRQRYIDVIYVPGELPDTDFGDKYLHQLYVTLKSNGQLPPLEPTPYDNYIPLELRLQKYDIPFDPKLIDRSPEE
ncbi:hypothetical protein P170DRAFT_420683 [Aspergillus steynii IBT 23096]|uniref:Uncharacterized protein n=1 Tax=Aspergillus steynii IBT 23096 TaxID=1392250 RepID=A0A2I2GLY8_9EURO|nr:uncharacterized protein P170DRAFT_420683 [Aspergillus steynii IBT 23096]PLB53886.1 hypothetical protein P170DRAFT_420683 [Aspergillus steynii IBT 23096]